MSTVSIMFKKTPKPTQEEIIKARVLADINRKEERRQQHLREISANYIKETTGFYLDTTDPLHEKQFAGTTPYKYQSTTSIHDLQQVYARKK